MYYNEKSNLNELYVRFLDRDKDSTSMLLL